MTTSDSLAFRRWWRPPRRTRDGEEERRVTYLELFYDLVYVVVIAEIAHALATQVDSRGVLQAAFLFVLVWVAWYNGAMYHDLHGHNDVRTRVFTFGQMFTVAAMAVFALIVSERRQVTFAAAILIYE